MFSCIDNEVVDPNEMANCLSLMCGGSVVDKIQAAFILFDINNSNSLSLEELSIFVRTVFKVLFDLIPQNS